MNNNGTLVISLDFELLWGVFDKVDWKEKEEYFINTRNVIPEILKLFQKNEISCTWATVGMLFNNNWDEWNQNIPEMLPEYDNEKLSAYKYGNSIQSKESEQLCFAPGLIKQIKETPGQEIATHTYSHYYCLESGQKMTDFRSDISKAIELAEKFECRLHSLVFPRNQFNNGYSTVCKELGIKNIRTNPDNWYWRDTQRDSLLQKISRTSDAYFGRLDKAYSIRGIQNKEGITHQKASRFLRPYNSKSILNKTKLRRVFSEMEESAKKGLIYHLWWHPHNFGEQPHQSLTDLGQILLKYGELKNKYGYQSLNMKELGNYTIQ
ncbi:polysaccharide deacetylase family protein [Christiangramia sp.]|uniref:polysaccharide deacetylase family protein n=1 Tax=Christiangramia sp. TaxID=1931228 RepID=UPI002602BD0A|nr:polysaccharide deacetylase family protein [Christiangramia sp.]